MHATEVRKLAALEDRHWWYKERRALLARELATLPRQGRALDIGAAGGGNTRVLRAHGLQPVAMEYGAPGAQVAQERGLEVVRADARYLPLQSDSMEVVTAFDVLEHILEDDLAAREIARVLCPGGTLLVAVPCDMRLWSAHDEAVDHVRRYDREGLTELIEKAGLTIESLWSWNVLLRPVAAWRRKRTTGSELGEMSPFVNTALTAIVAAERYLPVRSLPGVTLMLRARKV